MPTLRAPGAPVTRASPTVIMTASTLPAAKASMDGEYSNHEKSTSTPSSLNQPFWMPISKAVQAGQSENAMRNVGRAGGGDFADPAAAGGGAVLGRVSARASPTAPPPQALAPTAAATRTPTTTCSPLPPLRNARELFFMGVR